MLSSSSRNPPLVPRIHYQYYSDRWRSTSLTARGFSFSSTPHTTPSLPTPPSYLLYYRHFGIEDNAQSPRNNLLRLENHLYQTRIRNGIFLLHRRLFP